jgi:outer membrane protein
MRSCRFAIYVALVFFVSFGTSIQGAEKKTPTSFPEIREKNSLSRNFPTVRLSLRQAVRITMERNPLIAEALAKVRQAEQQAQEVYSDLFPSLQIAYSANWPKYQVGGGDLGPPDHVSRYDKGTARDRLNLPFVDYPYRIDPYRRFTGSVMINQPIFNGGRVLSDYAFGLLGVNSAQLQVLIDRQDLILAVYTASYNMELARKLLDVVNESIRTLEILKGINSKLFKAGVVTKTDVLSTEGQLAVAAVQRRTALTDIERNRALLVNLLSYPPETPLDVAVNYKYVPNDYAIPQIYVTAFSNRDEIRQANVSIQQALQEIKSAKAALMPTISIQAQGTRTNDDWNVLDPEGSMNWQMTGNLTWNFNMFRSNATVKEKRQVEQERIAARQKLIQNITEEVKTAYLEMKRTEGDISDYGKAVSLRTENFALFQRRYQEGDVSFTEVLISQQELIQAKADYYRSLIGYRVNQAILERRMGILRQ